MMTPTPDALALSVGELSETVKELVRIIQSFPNYAKLGGEIERRLTGVYQKASRAKDRVT
jgi:hypothetical protein